MEKLIFPLIMFPCAAAFTALGIWASAILGLINVPAAGILVMVVCVLGIPGLVITYNRIYKKYKA